MHDSIKQATGQGQLILLDPETGKPVSWTTGEIIQYTPWDAIMKDVESLRIYIDWRIVHPTAAENAVIKTQEFLAKEYPEVDVGLCSGFDTTQTTKHDVALLFTHVGLQIVSHITAALEGKIINIDPEYKEESKEQVEVTSKLVPFIHTGHERGRFHMVGSHTTAPDFPYTVITMEDLANQVIHACGIEARSLRICIILSTGQGRYVGDMVKEIAEQLKDINHITGVEATDADVVLEYVDHKWEVKKARGLGPTSKRVFLGTKVELGDLVAKDWEGARTPFTLEEFIEHYGKFHGKVPHRFYFEHPILEEEMKVIAEMKRRLKALVGEEFVVTPTFFLSDVSFSVRRGKITVTKSRETSSGFEITL